MLAAEGCEIGAGMRLDGPLVIGAGCAIGADYPAPVVDHALAQGVRGLAKVGGARGNGFSLAKELGSANDRLKEIHSGGRSMLSEEVSDQDIADVAGAVPKVTGKF